jgi:hypothetical protein
MNTIVRVSGISGQSALHEIAEMVRRRKPKAIGLASAFVSIKGVEKLAKAIAAAGDVRCRLVAGTDHAITHPEALALAQRLGWQLRLGTSAEGIFHPKLLVGGRAFTRDGGVLAAHCIYVGSSNLTAAGLEKSVECGVFDEGGPCGPSASDAFAAMWANARLATESALRSYAAVFAETSRKRSAAELRTLGVADGAESPVSARDLKRLKSPSSATMDERFAVSAWAGLQSFTGEYRFQLEFPKDAGRVVSQLVARQRPHGGKVDVYCPDDGVTRPMHYAYYHDNGMFRLNIPNDVKGVEWARKNRDGIALVESGPAGGPPLRLRLLRPGDEASEVVAKSIALSTWGKTPTRGYGWF